MRICTFMKEGCEEMIVTKHSRKDLEAMAMNFSQWDSRIYYDFKTNQSKIYFCTQGSKTKALMKDSHLSLLTQNLQKRKKTKMWYNT